MSDAQIMQDPYRSEIEGQKIVTHEFNHGIDYQINLSHVLLAIGIVVAIYVYKTRLTSSDDSETDTNTPNVIDTTD
jgi:hypothetical protein